MLIVLTILIPLVQIVNICIGIVYDAVVLLIAASKTAAQEASDATNNGDLSAGAAAGAPNRSAPKSASAESSAAGAAARKTKARLDTATRNGAGSSAPPTVLSRSRNSSTPPSSEPADRRRIDSNERAIAENNILDRQLQQRVQDIKVRTDVLGVLNKVKGDRLQKLESAQTPKAPAAPPVVLSRRGGSSNLLSTNPFDASAAGRGVFASMAASAAALFVRPRKVDYDEVSPASDDDSDATSDAGAFGGSGGSGGGTHTPSQSELEAMERLEGRLPPV